MLYGDDNVYGAVKGKISVFTDKFNVWPVIWLILLLYYYINIVGEMDSCKNVSRE